MLTDLRPFAACVAAVAATTAVAAAAFAAAADYRFQPLSVDVKSGAGAELAVQLVHTPSGKPVAGAVLFRTRLDMAPENMAEHTGALAAMPSSEPGVYKFKAELSMTGAWALHIQAKVPGEAETVEATVVFKAKD